MAKYPDKDEWIEEILIPDRATPILGGQPVWEGDRLVDGFANVSVGQLANRTRHLKNRVEQVELGGVPEAPEEGIGFVRKDKSWVPEKTVAALDPSTGLSETDRLALSQSGHTSGEYWRVLVHTDTEGGSGGRRIVEIQFREQEGVPQTRVDETIRGYNVSDVYPSVNAFDENLTYYTGSSTAGVPFGVGLSRSVPWTVREIAIYYPSTVSLSGRHSPGTFDIQVSSDGENWATVASVESFAHPSSGWYTFSTESSAVERSASLSQLKDFMAVGVPEAPVDGKLYGRKDEGWEEVPEAEEFDISGLPVATTLQNSDYLPVSQSAAPSVRFWRLTVLSNTENDTNGYRNRLYEMQFREIAGVPQTAEPATVTGTGWPSSQPAGNVVDGDTSTYAGGRSTSHPPYTVMFEYPEPVAIQELAIFYPSSSTFRRESPGNFRVEYSEDGSIWNTALEVSGYSDPSIGWNTWGLFGDTVQRRTPLQQLKEFLGGDDGGIPEAPADGKLYGRKDESWEEVPTGGSAPVVWIEGAGEEVLLTDLSPNAMYILDVRSGNWVNVCIPENHTSIPVGAEYHFVCAGNPQNAYIYEYSTTED